MPSDVHNYDDILFSAASMNGKAPYVPTDDYPRYVFNGQPGHIVPDYGEQLDRIEKKLDRLLAILDKDKGLWVAPSDVEIVGNDTFTILQKKIGE